MKLQTASIMGWAQCLVILFIATVPVQGELPRTFSFDSVWTATHIVVTDDSGTVVETWKGDSVAGERLDLEELGRPLMANHPREGGRFSLGSGDPLPELKGERMILFLLRDDATMDSGRSAGWKPASFDGALKTSVLWVEKNRVYGCRELTSPGAAFISPMGLNEDELYLKVADILSRQDALYRDAALDDPFERAERMLDYVHLPYAMQRDDGPFAVLERCGEAALPVLRQILATRGQPPIMAGLAVDALVAAVDGPTAARELVAIVGSQTIYWGDVGAQLDEGWWGHRPMSEHYGVLLEALSALRELPMTSEGLAVVEDMGALWRAYPVLDKVGNGQLSKAVEAVLHKGSK